MNVNKIIDAVGNINDEYIEDAALSGKKVRFARYGWIAAAIAVVFALVFFQTPPGVAAFSAIKENVIEIVERLFPPKNITVYVEGESEIVSHIPAVQEASTAENGSYSVPGFIIYYDPEIYTEIKEHDVTYIRYISDDNLPDREIEIRHISDMKPQELAVSVMNEMSGKTASVSEIYDLYGTEALCFDFYEGDEWDSVCGNISFFSDEKDGTFQITARYFGEAQEGHGVRFSQMLQTFEVIE